MAWPTEAASRASQTSVAGRYAEGDVPRVAVRARPRRWVLALDPAEGAGGLGRLGRALYEGACAFYLDDARRRLALHSERRSPAPAASARVAFKVGCCQLTCPLPHLP